MEEKMEYNGLSSLASICFQSYKSFSESIRVIHISNIQEKEQ